jgi:tRNA(Ile)-lysidine synthase
MYLLSRFIDHIQNENLFQKKDHLLLAVSGGGDSIVLCELCHQAGFHFDIAHCNFQLRGEESDLDESLVKSLGEKYKSQVFIKKFETEKYATEKKLSIQVAARELRYEWFYELLNELPAAGNQGFFESNHGTLISYILTAHHANDNVETLLINFLKGTGIRGLIGIPLRQGKIVRPLLFAMKEEITAFAAENKLVFREDASNASDKYTRNYIRNKLIPAAKEVFPKVEHNMLNNIERFNDIHILFHEAILHHKKKLIEKKGNEIHIPVLKLFKSEPLKTIIYEIIHEYGFTPYQADEVVHLLQSQTGKLIMSPAYKIIKNRKWIIISPINTGEGGIILIEENDREIGFVDGKLLISKSSIAKYKQSSENFIATLDASRLEFPLLLRKWKQGDYFYPLGMKKPSGAIAKKKLSRFFTDLKLSLSEKEKIWVIESNRKIVWMVGKRLDDRFKVRENTSEIYRIQFKAL